MPPYLPTFGISRSQSVRVGQAVLQELNSGDTLTNPETGALIGPTYVDLGTPAARRDYQRHQAMGAIIDVGSTSSTVYSDLFSGVGTVVAGLAVTASTGFSLAVSAGTVQSRYSGGQIGVAAIGASTLIPAVPPAFGGRTDYVLCNAAGQISLLTGPTDSVAPTYDSWTVANSSASTTFKLNFVWNGFTFTTGTTAAASTGAALATLMLAATGGPNNCAFSAFAGAGALTGTGAGFPTSAVITAAVGAEGPITNMWISNVSGAATYSVTHTTVGSGAINPFPTKSQLVLASVYVPSTATTSANYVISTGPLMTS